MSESTTRDILNVDEAAALLGVSIKTFNKVLHSQNLPARKIGREWKFSRQALIDWVGSGRSRDFYRDLPSEGPSDVSSNDATSDDLAGERRDVVSPNPRRTRRTAGWNIEY